MNIPFEKICRTCMVESASLLPIFDNSTNSPIIKMLKSFTTIQVHQSDGLPENICLTCLGELNRVVSFKQKCERSESALKAYAHKIAPERMKYTKICVFREELAIAEQLSETDETLKETVDFIIKNDVIDDIMYEDAKEPDKLKNDLETKDYQCYDCNIGFTRKCKFEQHKLQCHSVDDGQVDYNYDVTGGGSSSSEQQDSDEEEEKHVTVEVVYNEETDGTPIVNEPEKAEPLIQPLVMEPALKLTTKFKCSKCSANFVKEKSLNIHLNLNKCTEKAFECQICKKVFVRMSKLKVHMRIHSDIKEYSCEKCAKQFRRQDQLTIHMQNHNPKRKHQCTYCPKSFNMISTLKDHIRTHNGERPYLCSICGKGFSQGTNLKQHVMRHTNTKPYVCKYCSYSFVSKGELDAHLRKHTGDHPFVCDTCGSGFTTSSSLVKHKRIHTGERPYACEYCPMRFTALGTLKNHRRTHTGERPFPCKYCDRSFAQKSDCSSHQRTHSAIKQFQCPHCPRSFHQNSALRSHMKKYSNANHTTAIQAATALQSFTESSVLSQETPTASSF